MKSESNKNIKEEFRVLKMIFYSIAVSQILFFIVSFFIVRNKNLYKPELNGLIQFILPAVILICIISYRFIYNKRVKNFDKSLSLPQKFSSYKTSNIIKWALIDAANLVVVIAFLFTGYYLYAILFVIILALFFINGAGEEKFIYEYELKPEEIETLN